MDVLGLFGLLMLLFAGWGKDKPSPSSPSSPSSPGIPASTPPWPQVTPSGLPPFPGSGWEYDEPPPLVVQQRAGQLLSQLWAGGSGTYRIEQTAGRWIAFRAEIVKSGKKGVVAYRLKTAAPAPTRPPAASPAPRAPASPAPLPAQPGGLPGIQSRSPGIPQAAPTSSWSAPSAPSSPSSAPSPLSLPDLKVGRGMKPAAPDADVMLLQQKLGVTPVDGRFGKDTQTAVIKFQQQTGLAPANQTIEQLRARGFGAVKQATWVALFAVRA